jgi:hypothetical protein
MLLLRITLLLSLIVYYRNALVSVGSEPNASGVGSWAVAFWPLFVVNVYIGLNEII